MLKYRDITLQRLDKFTSSDQWKDVNLSAQLYPNVEAGEEWVKIKVFSVPELKRIPFEEATKGDFQEAKVHQEFGPSWSTHWFHISVKVPSHWKGQKVEFHWDGNGEGLIWTKEGSPIHGLTGGTGGDRRVEYVLTEKAQGNEQVEFYIEHACNGMFGNGDGISAPDPNRKYRLSTAHLVTVNETAIQLLRDFEVVRGIAKELPKESNQGAKALYTANEIVNAFRRQDPESMKKCREIAKEFFKERNGTSQHAIAI
ncbi:Glycoside hydrolase, 38 vacuolar alpha mannosidase [Basidiobolus ranarum]|uniref:Glycoside hydrolase, 38 vacuolar alpha mannosidase n=1 Tax=Basidiobolus ranarum TaxID=34480 RepID=A0ABR2WTU9_9FUNG